MQGHNIESEISTDIWAYAELRNLLKIEFLFSFLFFIFNLFTDIKFLFSFLFFFF